MDRSLLQSLNILHIFNDGFQASMLLLLPFIAKDLHASYAQSGLLGAAMNTLQVFLALPAGYVAVRFGGLRVLIIGALLSALGFIGVAFGPTLAILVLLFFLAGVGFAVFHPIAFSMVARAAEKKSIGRTMGLFTATGDVGRIGLTAVITVLIVQFGWRNTALIYGFAGFLVFFMFVKYLFVSAHSPSIQEIHAKPQKPLRLLEILKQPAFLMANLAGMLDSFASSSLFVFLPFLYLQKGIDAKILGSFTATFFIGNILGKYYLGRFVDIFGNSRVFITAELSMALFVVLLASTHSFVFIIIFSIVLGALTKGTVPVFQAMLSESVQNHGQYEKAYGLCALLVSSTTVIAPFVLGWVSDMYGIVASFYIVASFALLAIIPAFAFARVTTKS